MENKWDELKLLLQEDKFDVVNISETGQMEDDHWRIQPAQK